MKLRIGYLKERKVLLDVEGWRVKELEDAIRREFSLDENANFGIYFGESRVNHVKTAKITELGVVSGDLLLARIEEEPTEGIKRQKSEKTSRIEEMDTSAPSSSNIEAVNSEEKFLDLNNLLNLLYAHLLQMEFKELKSYNINELCGQTKVIYVGSEKTTTKIRVSCTLFFNGDEGKQSISIIQLNAALISGSKITSFDRIEFDDGSLQKKFDDFIQELKDSIFGPENPLLKVMLCGDVNLTTKLFELCGLESVVSLRRTCKIAYKKSNSRYLDVHYWKKQFISHFGERQLQIPSTLKNDPTPYRKLLFKKMRETDKAAYFNSIRNPAGRAGMMFQSMNGDHEILTDPRRPSPRFREPNPLGFDPLRNFNDNFYGQEIYRPRPNNPHIPGAPIIHPHIQDDTFGNRDQPNNPLQRPFGIARRNNDTFSPT